MRRMVGGGRVVQCLIGRGARTGDTRGRRDGTNADGSGPEEEGPVRLTLRMPFLRPQDGASVPPIRSRRGTLHGTSRRLGSGAVPDPSESPLPPPRAA